MDGAFVLEQDTGVEPASSAWEADVLPMYESCVRSYYISPPGEKQGENWRVRYVLPSDGIWYGKTITEA